MRPDQYNPKAREAFGRSLINASDSIFKGLMLLFTIVPLTLIFKTVSDGNQQFSLSNLFVLLTPESSVIFLMILTLAFILVAVFRKEGFRHLHELEDPGYKDQKRSLKTKAQFEADVKKANR